MKKKITLLVISVTIAMSTLFAQDNTKLSIGEFDPYISEYFKPMAQGIAVSMGSGWVHTAKTHSKLGFDVTFSAAFTSIPASEASFTSSDISGMENDGYYFSNGTQDSRPPSNDIITFPNIRTDGDEGGSIIHKELSFSGVSGIINYKAISGLTAKYAGAASIQAGIGLPKGIELMIRYFPDVSGMINAGVPSGVDMEMLKTSYWGIGIKHDLKQWIPAIKKVPFLQMSALFTYSSFNTGFAGDDLILDPGTIVGDIDNVHDNSGASYDDQKFEMKVSSFTGAFLIGANIPVFQPFIGVGFNSGKFDAGLTGTFPIINVNADYNPLLPETDPNSKVFIVNEGDIETDPLNVEARTTEFNLQMGARLKLGFFVLHYQYTRQKFNMHSGGIAITFR